MSGMYVHEAHPPYRLAFPAPKKIIHVKMLTFANLVQKF